MSNTRHQPKAPSFKKPEGMKKLSGWNKKNELPSFPPPVSPERVANLVDSQLALWTSALGDESLAKKLMKMKATKYPDATLPELVALEWLERKRIKHTFQQWLLGGRAIRGGQVVDIVIDNGGSIVIVEVQGNYWHNRPGARQRDEAQRFALIGLSVFGKRVSAVVEAWESRLVNPKEAYREQVMQMALLGVSLGP